MNGCQITIDKLHGGQYDMWLCCFRVPILLLMQNVFGSNKESIDNEYEIHSLLHFEEFHSELDKGQQLILQNDFWHENRSQGKLFCMAPLNRHRAIQKVDLKHNKS